MLLLGIALLNQHHVSPKILWLMSILVDEVFATKAMCCKDNCGAADGVGFDEPKMNYVKIQHQYIAGS